MRRAAEAGPERCECNLPEPSPLSTAADAGMLVKNLLFRGLLRMESRDVDLVPCKGRAIIVANHASYLDPSLIHLAVHAVRRRYMRWLAWDRLFEIPVVRSYVAAYESIPLSLDGADLSGWREAVRLLRAGHLVGIFPEGGVSEGEGPVPGPFAPGALRLALRTGAPIVPVSIRGTWRMFRGRLPYFGGQIQVQAHRPYGFPPSVRRRLRADKDAQQRLMDEVRDTIAGAVGDAA